MTASAMGRSAGLLLLSPSLNPFNDGSADQAIWDKSWRSAVAEILQARDAERRRRAGLLGVSACGNPADYSMVKTPDWR